MATASATVSRWSRGFVAAGALWFVAWQVAALAGAPRSTGVLLGVYGFVLHVAFGKAYALVPSYFDRDLAAPRAPALHLPLAVGGVAGLVAEDLGLAAGWSGPAGGALWAGGVAVFVGTLGWTVRDNLSGRETGTGEHNAARRPVDRVANAAVPVAVAYLAAGASETLAVAVGGPTLLGAYGPVRSHLFAAGFAALLLFAVGFRLLPRFLVAAPPAPLAWVVLGAGALGPLFLALGLPGGRLLLVGAALEGTAVLGFAAAYGWLFAASDRDRVGFYPVLAGVVAGVLGVALGVHLALAGVTTALATAHYRLMALGFLSLAVVGVTVQFYPPSVGRFPGAGDRAAWLVVGALVAGLGLEVVGLLAGTPVLAVAGRTLVLAGAVGYAYLLLGLFVQRARA
ncbi:MAG: hypothetical protein ABEJ30_02675 [Halorientalis sp.]